jgi:hypothetical protein
MPLTDLAVGSGELLTLLAVIAEPALRAQRIGK